MLFFGFLLYYVQSPGTQILDIYVFGVILFISVGLKNFHTSLTLKKIKSSHLILLTLFYFIPRIIKLSEQVIWVDEYIQYLILSRIPKGDFLLSVIKDAQPPLDYLLSNLSVSLFGANQLSLKLSALLMGYLSIILCYRIGQQYRLSNQVCLIGCLMFMSYPLVFGYQIEARPYSLAILTGMLLIFCHEEYIQSPGKSALVRVFSSTLLHLFSIGFQPMFFVATIALYMGSRARNKIHYFSSVFFAFIICSPFFGIFYFRDKERHIFIKKKSLPISRLFSEIFENHITYITSNIYWTITFLVIVLISLYIKYKSKYLKIGFYKPFLMPIIFLLILTTTYSKLINWPFYTRYSILLTCFIPFIFYNSVKDLKFNSQYSHGVIFLYICFNLVFFPLSLREMSPIFGHNPWIKLYQRLNSQITDRDQLLFLHYDHNSQIHANDYVSSKIYGNDIVKNKSNVFQHWPKTAEWPIFLNQKLDYCKSFDGFLYTIYFDNYRWPNTTLLKLNVERGHELIFQDMAVHLYKLKSEGSLYKTYKSYFNDILETYGKSIKTIHILETLIVLDFLYGNDFDYKHNFEKLKGLTLENKNISHLFPRRIHELEQEFQNNKTIRKHCSESK